MRVERRSQGPGTQGSVPAETNSKMTLRHGVNRLSHLSAPVGGPRERRMREPILTRRGPPVPGWERRPGRIGPRAGCGARCKAGLKPAPQRAGNPRAKQPKGWWVGQKIRGGRREEILLKNFPTKVFDSRPISIITEHNIITQTISPLKLLISSNPFPTSND